MQISRSAQCCESSVSTERVTTTLVEVRCSMKNAKRVNLPGGMVLGPGVTVTQVAKLVWPGGQVLQPGGPQKFSAIGKGVSGGLVLHCVAGFAARRLVLVYNRRDAYHRLTEEHVAAEGYQNDGSGCIRDLVRDTAAGRHSLSCGTTGTVLK